MPIVSGLKAYLISAAIGFAILSAATVYHLIVVSGYKDTISTQSLTIGVLEGNVETLKTSNASLLAANEDLRDSAIQSAAEILSLTSSDARSQERIALMERAAANKRDQERRQAILDSRKASLLLRFINANIACETASFTIPAESGRCIAGIFKSEDPTYPSRNFRSNPEGDILPSN